MDAFRTLAALLLVWLLGNTALAQEAQTLPLFTPVTGTLASGETDQWAFSAADGAMLSAHVRSVSGDLDPVLTLTDSAGSVIFSNDDYDYPESRDALLQGITMPRRDTFTLSVTAFGGTGGDYELTLLPGFANLTRQETFDDETRWETEGDALETIFGNNRMALIVSGGQQRGIAAYSGGEAWDDHYIHIQIPELSARTGWQIGLIARQQDAQNYYRYSLNDQGQWRFLVRTDDGERVIRDWSNHPAIIAGQTQFSLGLLVNGAGFDFFYNGQLIGRLTDRTITEAGQIALIVETPGALDSEVTAQFENLVITTPLETALPNQILTGNSSVMVQELQRRRLVPAAGQMGLIVPESFLTYNRPGVNELPLGGNQTYRTFALGTTVTWEIATPTLPAGCGLLLRSAGDGNYLLAYLERTGGYGLSQRRGDQFEPGIFGEMPEPGSGPHRLLVIAGETQVIYYINGRLAGTLESDAVSGAVGNAVINFEATTTSCQFSDTWVWAWG
jgi:hypothetical protein